MSELPQTDAAEAPLPVAGDSAAVLRLAVGATASQLSARVSVCRACPRLVDWREEVARTRRPAHREETYWGRPVPASGAIQPRVLIIGLAPSAHGANRTGLNFTGDRSGDTLFAGLRRAGLAINTEPTALRPDPRLPSVRIVAAVRCAPPANKPTAAERATCRPWLARDIALAWPSVRCVLVLGRFGYEALWPALQVAGVDVPDSRPRFGHGVQIKLHDGRTVICSYHVSPLNIATGRLTDDSLDEVLAIVAVLARAKQSRSSAVH